MEISSKFFRSWKHQIKGSILWCKRLKTAQCMITILLSNRRSSSKFVALMKSENMASFQQLMDSWWETRQMDPLLELNNLMLRTQASMKEQMVLGLGGWLNKNDCPFNNILNLSEILHKCFLLKLCYYFWLFIRQKLMGIIDNPY